MRVCLVYDCLFPYTVGGAERWYRNLGERLASEGHEVTLLTLRQWPRGEHPDLPGVRVVSAGPRMKLYVGGRRRVAPPLVFGAGALWHLLRHGRAYDVVHTASFPYFSLLAAALARPVHSFGLVVDWHEVWTRSYWREYLGRAGGDAGWAVQRLCARIGHRAFAFSHLHAGRLAEEGHRGPVTVLEGEYAGATDRPSPRVPERLVVFAGRHIPEKRVTAIVPALERARESVPDLRALILGDGPERPAVMEAVDAAGLREVVEVPGFVSPEEVDAALRRALCMLLPSRREGYGMVVVEASARGTPSVVAAGPDNAAVELVEDGVNGRIAGSAAPEDLARAIVRVAEDGMALRDSTCDWFERNGRRLSLGSSLERVVQEYGQLYARP